MHLLAVGLALLSGVSATRLLQLARGTQPVNVVLQMNKATSEVAIDVWNDDKTELLAHSCSRSLASGSFEEAQLVFAVDEHGAGTLQVGPQTYTVHDNPKVSGGIVCGRVSGPSETLVSCDVPIPASLPLKSLSKRELEDCFPRGLEVMNLFGVVRGLEGATTNDTAWSNNTAPFHTAQEGAPAQTTADAVVSKRQGPCAIWTATTIRVGDGNPHQNPLHIQVSEPMECGYLGCSIEHTAIRSFTIGWSADLSPVQWISGGFAVQETIETGNAYGCPGGPYDFFAVWRKVGQTAYTIQNALFNACTGTRPDGRSFVIWSPNESNRGGNFYCVYSRQYVRAMGDRYIDKSPEWPGGP